MGGGFMVPMPAPEREDALHESTEIHSKGPPLPLPSPPEEERENSCCFIVVQLGAGLIPFLRLWVRFTLAREERE